MNKIVTYLFIVLSLLMATTMSVYASDEYIITSLNYVGVYTGVAQGAVNKVSQYSQKINSAKTMVGGYLGDKVSAAKEKVELAQEKVENAQEKAEKVKERAEWAKEQKQALMDKYNNLNSKLSEYKEKAMGAIKQAQEIRDQYKTYKDQIMDLKDQVMEYKDEVTTAINDAKDMKDNIVDGVSAVKTLAEDKLNAVKEKAGMSSEGEQTFEASSGVVNNTQFEISNSPSETMINTQPALSATRESMLSETSPQPIKASSNRADAIMSAGIFAGQPAADSISVDDIDMLEQESPLLQQNTLSPEEIIEYAKTINPDVEEAQSDLNIEEQLEFSSTKIRAKASDKEAKTLINSTKISSNREKFGAEKEIKKETKELPMKTEQKTTEKKSKSKKEDIRKKKGAAK